MSQTVSFNIREGLPNSIKVPFTKPAGTVVAKFYVSKTSKAIGSEIAGVVTWDASNVIFTFTGAQSSATNFPARYTLTLAVDGGAAYTALKGTVGLTEASASKSNVSTAVTTVGNLVPFRVDGFAACTFYFHGTFAGANFTFEQSPDSTNGTDGTWFPTMGSKIDANTAVTATGAISAASAYDVSVPGAAWVRARLTAITSGTVNAQVTGSVASIETAPVIPTHAVTQSGTWTAMIGKTTTGGLTRHRLLTAAGTNATLVKNTAGQVYTVHAYNNTAAVKFLKFYNKASAPTVGTDTPVETYPLPPNAWTRISFEDIGNAFATGIGIAVTGAIADNDTTAVAANDVVVNTHYA